MIGTNSLHQPEDNESSVFADRIYFRPIGPADSVAPSEIGSRNVNPAIQLVRVQTSA